MARFEAPVMNTSLRAPASSASCTAYWISGLSTTGSISFGLALVAGRKRVPRPATGNTAVRIGLAATALIANRSISAAVDALAQILAGLEVRHVFAGQRHGLAGFGVPPLARWPEMQREAA